MGQRAKTLTLSLAAIVLFAPASFADAGHHEDGPGAAAVTSPIKSQPEMLGMGAMGKMGGDQMQMMQAMMKMHMSMMGQMHGTASAQMQLSQLFANGATSSEIMARFDENGDGAIDLAEFETWDTQARWPSLVDRFQALDADGIEAISADEIEAALKANLAGGNTDRMMSGTMAPQPKHSK